MDLKPLVANKKKIEHSDPDAIKIVSESTPLHGSTCQRTPPAGGIHGHVAIFTINPGQEVFSEKMTMHVERFENSKIVGSNFVQHVTDNQMTDDHLPQLLLDLFKQDSYADAFFGTAASSLMALDTSYDKLAGSIDQRTCKEPEFGLFMGCAMMRHCCNPNVELTFNDKRDGVVVRAIKHIPRGAELTRDWIAEHYQHNLHNKSILKGQDSHKRQNNLDLEKNVDDGYDGSVRMNELIGGLSYSQRNEVHKEMFGRECSCYWCMQCRSNDRFRKADDFVRKSINTTHFNTDMIDIGTIPDTKVNMLRAVIRLLEDAYMENQFCNIPVLSRSYVQLSAALLMIGLNSEGSEALSVATSYCILARGKTARETNQLITLLKKRHIQPIALEMLPVFRAQTFGLPVGGKSIDGFSKSSGLRNGKGYDKLTTENMRRSDSYSNYDPKEIVDGLLAGGAAKHQHLLSQQPQGLLPGLTCMSVDSMSDVSSLHNSYDGYSDTLSVGPGQSSPKATVSRRKVVQMLQARPAGSHGHDHHQPHAQPGAHYHAGYKSQYQTHSDADFINDVDGHTVGSSHTLHTEEIVGKLRESRGSPINDGVSGLYFEEERAPPSKNPRRARTPKAVRDMGSPVRNEEKGAVDYERLSASPVHRMSRTREGVTMYKFAGDPDDSDCMSDTLSLASSMITGSVTNMWGVRESDINSFMTGLSLGGSVTSSGTGSSRKPAHLQKTNARLYNNSSSNRSLMVVPNKDVQRSLKRWKDAHIDIHTHSSSNPKEKYNNLLSKAFNVLSAPRAATSSVTGSSVASIDYLDEQSLTSGVSLARSVTRSRSPHKRNKATYFQKKLLHQQLLDEILIAERSKHSPDKLENPVEYDQVMRESEMRTIRNISSPLAQRDIPATGGAGDGPTADHYFHPFGVQPKGFAKRVIHTSERLQRTKDRKQQLPKVQPPPAHLLRTFSKLDAMSPKGVLPSISPVAEGDSKGGAFSPMKPQSTPAAASEAQEAAQKGTNTDIVGNCQDSPAPTKVNIVPLPAFNDTADDEDEDEDEAGDAF